MGAVKFLVAHIPYIVAHDCSYQSWLPELPDTTAAADATDAAVFTVDDDAVTVEGSALPTFAVSKSSDRSRESL